MIYVSPPDDAVATGLDALDHILAGGYAANRIHLIEGKPGSGKTTLALHFLLEARRADERCLYITLSESREELLKAAASHGFDVSGIDFFELIPPELSLDEQREQSVLYLSDLELGETVRLVKDAVEATAPTRVVLDSLSDIRMLAQGAVRYRRQVLALKRYFTQRGCTALFLDDITQEDDDVNLHSLAHGVIRLEQLPPAYGKARRRLRVFKMRGRDFRSGYHDLALRPGGIALFPRLVAAEHAFADEDDAPVASGLEALDSMIGGGLDRGTATLVIGPSGAGKSTLCMQFFHAAVARGEKGIFVSFDETKRNFLRRGKGLGLDFSAAMDSGAFIFRQVDPAELSSGELTQIVREHVEAGFGMLAIDSLGGYQHALPEERFLLLQMHELLTYLNQAGVVSFVVVAQTGIVGAMQAPIDLTYLSDTVILLRFFEAQGELRRAISIVKKRTGFHEATIREIAFATDGLKVGDPLHGFHGVMTGTPNLRELA
jgi:circadian clock protein KaiC